jgi:hypothetical protein
MRIPGKMSARFGGPFAKAIRHVANLASNIIWRFVGGQVGQFYYELSLSR